MHFKFSLSTKSKQLSVFNTNSFECSLSNAQFILSVSFDFIQLSISIYISKIMHAIY